MAARKGIAVLEGRIRPTDPVSEGGVPEVKQITPKRHNQGWERSTLTVRVRIGSLCLGSTEDEIARQLERSQPVQINARGEIVPLPDTRLGADGQLTDKQGQPTTQLKPQRWYSTEDEIARQLERSQPVQINARGEIVLVEEVREGTDGQLRDRQSGQPTTQLKPQRWYSWYESDSRRLLQEKEAMALRFPGFQLYKTDSGLAWHGTVKPERSGTSYRIAVVYPESFPYSAPKVYVLSPRIRAPKHQYGDGSLCLMYPGDGTWDTNTTAVQIVAMASTWLFCYEYHDTHCPSRCSAIPCRYWPGAEA